MVLESVENKGFVFFSDELNLSEKERLIGISSEEVKDSIKARLKGVRISYDRYFMFAEEAIIGGWILNPKLVRSYVEELKKLKSQVDKIKSLPGARYLLIEDHQLVTRLGQAETISSSFNKSRGNNIKGPEKMLFSYFIHKALKAKGGYKNITTDNLVNDLLEITEKDAIKNPHDKMVTFSSYLGKNPKVKEIIDEIYEETIRKVGNSRGQ